MKQFENYLSRITSDTIRKVLIFPKTKEFLETIHLLEKYTQLEKIYYVPSTGKQLTNIEDVLYSYNVEMCDISDLKNSDVDADMILFDYDRAEDVEILSGQKAAYLIGRMDENEDYYAIWETYREKAQHVYIEQRKTNHAEYEIFEWEKSKTDIELSVILPVFNVAAYLPRCIESLIEWKAPYVEYLFIDDGSTDESAAIITQYSDKDKRIRLIQKKNGGCASARNRGLEEAKGRYIGFVDADDFIESDMFYQLLRRAFLGNYDYTYCGFQEYYEDTGKKEPIRNDCISGNYLSGEYDSSKVKLLTVNTKVAIWRGLYKKSILDKHQIKFYEKLKMFDDLPFRVEYIFAAQSAVCVPQYLYNYRIGRTGQDTACTDDRLYVHFQIFQYLDVQVQKYKDQRLWDILQAVKIQTHEFALSKIEKRCRRRYAKQAKQQLKEHAGYIRNVMICLIYAGRGSIGWLTKLWLGLM